MQNNDQIIVIKGTKEGLTLFIDEQCSFQTVIQKLSETTYTDEPLRIDEKVPITVHVGHRYLTEEDKEQIINTIEGKSNLIVRKIISDVILKNEAMKLVTDQETKVIHKIVRSGQVIEEKGDVLLIGDVNPGGMIKATGNIYVLGNLLGIAHAGYEGNRKAVIIASYMNPSQLRIADYISRAPDYESPGVYMECGMIDPKENRIILNRLQTLSQLGIDLSGFERRIENG